jgi:hypothetical protein
MPDPAIEPLTDSRRVVLAVEFHVRAGAPYADTDESLARNLADYLNADEVNGLPFAVVAGSFVVIAINPLTWYRNHDDD